MTYRYRYVCFFLTSSCRKTRHKYIKTKSFTALVERLVESLLKPD